MSNVHIELCFLVAYMPPTGILVWFVGTFWN